MRSKETVERVVRQESRHFTQQAAQSVMLPRSPFGQEKCEDSLLCGMQLGVRNNGSVTETLGNSCDDPNVLNHSWIKLVFASDPPKLSMTKLPVICRGCIARRSNLRDALSRGAEPSFTSTLKFFADLH
jgi:hypothetical protein